MFKTQNCCLLKNKNKDFCLLKRTSQDAILVVSFYNGRKCNPSFYLTAFSEWESAWQYCRTAGIVCKACKSQRSWLESKSNGFLTHHYTVWRSLLHTLFEFFLIDQTQEGELGVVIICLYMNTKKNRYPCHKTVFNISFNAVAGM